MPSMPGLEGHTSRLSQSEAFQPPPFFVPGGTTAATWQGSSAKPAPRSFMDTRPEWPSSRRFQVRFTPVSPLFHAHPDCLLATTEHNRDLISMPLRQGRQTRTLTG